MMEKNEKLESIVFVVVFADGEKKRGGGGARRIQGVNQIWTKCELKQ